MFDLDKLIVGDVETDALYGYTEVHCCVFQDMEGKEYVFTQPSRRPEVREDLKKFLSNYRTLAGHNFISFDYGALTHLLPGVVPDTLDILDTLILSRLVNYKRRGGHSIAAYGETFGVKKEGKDIEDFSTFTDKMLRRCRSDVEINRRILEGQMRFLRDPEWQPAIEIEHYVQWKAQEMSKNGLPFDTVAAEALKKELEDTLAPIDKTLSLSFPARFRALREVTPRLTQKGTWNAQDFRFAATREYTYDASTRRVILGGPLAHSVPIVLDWVDGEPFTVGEMVPFNPASPSQIVERLNEAGWKPTEKTKGHLDHIKNKRHWKGSKHEYEDRLREYQVTGWKVSEENLKTLPDNAPEGAFVLAQRLTIASRLSDLSEWIELVCPDGRIHGQYSGIGAWTQRMAHAKPNTANIPVAKRSPKDTDFQRWVNDINDRMRGLFTATKGHRLVGTDADGIQMRIFAHLVGDEKLINALVNGDKANATDIHSVHQRALGDVCKSRDAAKTFIYAFLLGAGIAKVAEILECSQSLAKTAVNNFLEFYPGLKELKQSRIPSDAARGYFIGLDGRKVICDSEHLMLSGYLQNGEKIIMSYWLREWEKDAKAEGIPFDVLNWVHDEIQSLVPDNDNTVARFQELQLNAMVRVGEILRMKCPLAATSASGYTWKETH